VLRCVAVCCGVLQCVAVCCSVRKGGTALQRAFMVILEAQKRVCTCSVLQCDAVCCSLLQYVAVCCSALLLQFALSENQRLHGLT